MPKSIRIKESGSLGFDLTVLEIYHTSITASNLLTTVSASVLTGSSGIVVDNLPDSYDTFWAKCTTGECAGTTASLSVIGSAKPGVRFFNVFKSGDGDGTVQITAPTADGPTSASAGLEQTVNFNNDSLFTIQANEIYPSDFDGWYHVASGSEASPTRLATSSVLSITNTTFTGSDSFYAYFS